MTYVLLRGGLGNQLFQAAAATWASPLDVRFIETPAQTRQRQLDSFYLPNNFNKIEYELPLYKERYLNAALALTGARLTFINNAKRTILSKALPILIPDFQRVSIMSDLGFSNWLPSDEPELAIGYFQTYRYVQEGRVRKSLMELRPKANSIKFEKYVDLAKDKELLIVHLRRGDYRSEPKFGLLSARYYKKAIEVAIGKRDFEEIWLFSDEPQNYEQFVPKSFSGLLRTPEKEISDIGEIFELMRLGTGYVIANSSFSWWAATLSKREHVEVIAPVPWFAHRSSPTDLCPSNWIELKSEFEPK